MKLSIWTEAHCPAVVTPPVGAWIEIKPIKDVTFGVYVAPPVVAWIEIICSGIISVKRIVAPPVGAWIEIPSRTCRYQYCLGRSSCENVERNMSVLTPSNFKDPAVFLQEHRFNRCKM